MIQKTKIDSAVRKIISDLPETEKLKIEIQDLVKLVKRSCYDSLNESEKYFFDIYPEMTKKQSNGVNVGQIISCFCGDLGNGYYLLKAIDKILCTSTSFDISCDYPLLYSSTGYYGTIEIPNRLLRNENKKILQDLKDKSKLIYDLIEEIQNKEKRIYNILSSNLLTLPKLNKLSPKLYERYFN